MKTAGVIEGHDFLGCDITLKLLSENFRVKILVPDRIGNPVIQTGLKAGENLLYCRIDMENLAQMEDYIKDCDFLIHCGTPYKLDLKIGDGMFYIPVITHAGTLLQCLKNVQSIRKIIFFTSVAVYSHFNSAISPFHFPKQRAVSGSMQVSSEKAFYHSERIIDSILSNFTDNQIEIIVVSPVVVLNNILMNSETATQAGLRYIFNHEMPNDRIFQRLIRHKLVKTMVDANKLPDAVFDSINTYQGSEKSINLF